jgi:hypothetical protein
MTVHSASASSPGARGTPYSAIRMGLDAGRRRQREGSSQRRGTPAAAGDGGDGDAEGIVAIDVDSEAALGGEVEAVDCCSAGVREQRASDVSANIPNTTRGKILRMQVTGIPWHSTSS